MPIHSSNIFLSDNVYIKSPFCIGSNSFIAFVQISLSKQFIKSNNLMDLGSPILKIILGPQLVDDFGLSSLNDLSGSAGLYVKRIITSITSSIKVKLQDIFS